MHTTSHLLSLESFWRTRSNSMTYNHYLFAWVTAIASPVLFAVVVCILGWITPGYNHFFHTISQLVVRQFGFIQQLNFLQLCAGFLIAAFLFSKQVADTTARNILVRMCVLCAFFLIVVVLFPTDPRVPGEITSYTWSGRIHFIALAGFFFSAPLGIYKLQKALSLDSKLRRYSSLTVRAGGVLCVVTYIWTFLYLNQIWPSYLGLVQKGIVLITMIWYLQLLWAIRPTQEDSTTKRG
jgi:hypothetical protein